jgi:GAF domain-containing protein
VHAWPLRYRNQVIGSTEVYQATPGPITDADARLAESLATIVAISVLRERRQERADTLAGQLQQALNSRLVIEQAKGILAERVRVGVDQAFTMLRAHARRHQMRLALLAQQVVEGTLDTTLLASEPAPSSRRRTATPAALRRTARQETRRAAHDPA